MLGSLVLLGNRHKLFFCRNANRYVVLWSQLVNYRGIMFCKHFLPSCNPTWVQRMVRVQMIYLSNMVGFPRVYLGIIRHLKVIFPLKCPCMENFSAMFDGPLYSAKSQAVTTLWQPLQIWNAQQCLGTGSQAPRIPQAEWFMIYVQSWSISHVHMELDVYVQWTYLCFYLCYYYYIIYLLVHFFFNRNNMPVKDKQSFSKCNNFHQPFNPP